MRLRSSLLQFATYTLLSPVPAAVTPGQVVCRYTASTAATVNYYTCQELSDRYGITVNDFFGLNPTVETTCDNIKVDTEYCVRGYIQQVVSSDGFCGPSHGNTSCLDTDKQCCNSETWKCGNTVEDCMPGTCFSGACMGFPDKYSLDSKCGRQNNDKLCGGKWGRCCNSQGECGNGTAFCAESICQSGDCEIIYRDPWSFNTSTPGTTPSLPNTGKVSPDGSCGGANQYICKGSPFGDCCSSSGFCGSTNAHCTAGCQKDFGACTVTDLSPDGTCGGANKYQCKDAGFGDCCSSSGFCGSTTAHCTANCQTAFGICSNAAISPDGTCGGSNLYECRGSSFGNCCSSSGYCGVTGSHCGTGCQSNFGDCFIPVGSGELPSSSKVSTDGTCGGSAGLTCGGSTFGDCCSSGGYCGSSVNHCAQGCQKSFSSACLTSNVASLNGDCGASKGGYTCANGPFDGQCCSSGGFCGTTDAHCKSGCQTGYGTCK
ncbi:hypothetical protein FB567DRAFT_516115 [Paraphoma chrysanthemicola]|uniref:Carbohydrate-binding module family 18 protein n=1 Tax=Paraphoma chrysanthemicola TaxID=798071 RepID=A0A8K0RFP0_9PLEO|nr:hypothetical protein FB567DRAFT_516115 [Paraphoma chrysanthemicola]